MQGKMVFLVVIIGIIAAALFFLLFNFVSPKPQTPTHTPTASSTSQLTPQPTFTSQPTLSVPTSTFPPPVIPPVGAGDGGSELRVLVAEGGKFEEIVDVLKTYNWIAGDIDYSRATALYLYDQAWVSATYTDNYVHDLNLDRSFTYFGLLATIYMDSKAENGFCGIRTNVDGTGGYIDVLLYRNGTLVTIVKGAGGQYGGEERSIVYAERVQTDGRPYARIYIFFDEPGLTVIADYIILSDSVPSSQRVRIDHDHLIVTPGNGPLMLRAGTDYNQLTYCQFKDFFQYSIR